MGSVIPPVITPVTVVLALLVTAGQEWDVPVVTVGLVTIMLAALEETVT
tara:strand:+ start:257 stop:403 length:147 start_codon:yes stop_codon:yes gene_type:complete